MNEVDECIANIALCFQIHGKIKVIVLSFVISIDHLKQLHLLELIRDVSYHNGRSYFIFSHNLKEVNIIPLSIKTFLFFLGSFSLEF